MIKNKYIWGLVWLVLFLPYLGHTQDASVVTPPAWSAITNNYIRSWEAVKPDTAIANFTTSSTLQHSRMATQYFDGLGRPLQTVIKQGSYPTGGSAVDMVSSTVYNEWGLVQRQYLPFAANSTGGNTSISDGGFKTNPFQQQNWFYSNSNTASPVYGQGETYYYGKTELEASPFNRPERTYAPGNVWVHDGKGIQYKYWVNTVTDSVRIWKVTNSGTIGVFGSYSCDSLYKAGELTKNVMVDENDKQVIEFTDREGKVILKKVQFSAASDAGSGKGHYGWYCIYYIYDAFNLLRAVIQPRGVELLQANSWNITWNSNVILDEQCFRYEYDARRRPIMKKAPGAADVYMVYDRWDRLVLTQDANVRPYHNWLFIKYDQLNRPIITGVHHDPSTLTLAAMINNVKDNEFWQIRYETRNNSIIGYTLTQSYPYKDWDCVYTTTFYDDYGWATAVSAPDSNRTTTYDSYLLTASNSTWPYPQPVTQITQVRGMVTGGLTRVIDTEFFLAHLNIYDSKQRVIQVKSRNYTNGTDVQTTQYNFAGQPLLTISKTEKTAPNAQTSVIVTQLTYDDLCRVIRIEKKLSNTYVNSNAMSSYKTLAELQYDGLGQLKKKVLSPTGGAGGSLLGKLDYEYNIRGWLLSVNKNYITNVNSNQYFALELGYDKNASLGAFAPQYNGNISGALWKSEGDQQRRKYDFTYDVTNRLTGADFNQYVSGSGASAVFNKSAGMDFSTSGLTYDANGNILTQKQKGWKLSGSVTIDSLTYNYIPGSNRLLNVIDGVNDIQTRLGDFRTSSLHPNAGSKNSSTLDYSYDGNGNLVKDLNKDIVTHNGGNGVQYDHLNHLTKITFKKDGSSNKGYIEYKYDATGNRLRKTVIEPGVDTTITLYLGGAVYQDDTLQFLGHEEGRIRFAKVDSAVCTPQPNRFLYDYFIKDHLGSVRMVLTEQKENICYPAASVEDSRYQKEDDYYNIVNGRRIAKATTGATQASFENKLYRTHGGLTNEKTGLGIVLKVMPGDQVKIMAESYYAMPGGGAGSPLTLAVSELLAAMAASSAVLANKGALSTSDISGIGNNNADLGSFVANNNLPSNTAKAFVNYIIFDDQLRYVSSGANPVNTGGGYKLHDYFINNPVNITKSGYIYVFASNESNFSVYFDNLSVTHTPGPILEENHYYPFGLTMGGISSKSAGKLQNRYKYNSYEENKSFDLNLYETFYRSHDSQVGRFWQIDPKPNQTESGYAAMANNPILFFDALGDTVWIYHRNTSIMYQGGKLLNRDGSEYTKKARGFLKQTVNALNKASEASGEAAAMIGELQGSHNNFTIKNAFYNPAPDRQGQNEFKEDDAEKADAVRLKTDPALTPSLEFHKQRKSIEGGSGGIIYFNPNGGPVLVSLSDGSSDNNPVTNLIHELFHGRDANRGLFDGRSENGIMRLEWQASFKENIMRQQMGLKLRMSYSGVEILDGDKKPIPLHWVPAGW